MKIALQRGHIDTTKTCIERSEYGDECYSFAGRAVFFRGFLGLGPPVPPPVPPAPTIHLLLTGWPRLHVWMGCEAGRDDWSTFFIERLFSGTNSPFLIVRVGGQKLNSDSRLKFELILRGLLLLILPLLPVLLLPPWTPPREFFPPPLWELGCCSWDFVVLAATKDNELAELAVVFELVTDISSSSGATARGGRSNPRGSSVGRVWSSLPLTLPTALPSILQPASTGFGLLLHSVGTESFDLPLPPFLGARPPFITPPLGRAPPLLALSGSPFLNVVGSKPDNVVGDRSSRLLATEGERLIARFFVAKFKSCVGFLGLMEEDVLLLGEVDSEDRETETMRGLGFLEGCSFEEITAEGEVVLA